LKKKGQPGIFVEPPRLKWDFIRGKAEEFRKIFVDPIDLVPVPIVDIVELKLGIVPKREIQQCDFRTSDDWMHFREDFLTEDLNWFESHAYEFAGRLLVPKAELEKEIRIHQEKINQFKALVDNGEEELIEAVSRMLCQKFQVSYYVIQKRIRKEGIKL